MCVCVWRRGSAGKGGGGGGGGRRCACVLDVSMFLCCESLSDCVKVTRLSYR